MAHIQKYYISDILKDICNRMGDVTGAVFPDHRPSAKNEQMSELMVISIPSVLEEQNAWQKGLLRIELMVHDKKGGYADISRLDEMLKAVTEKFPIVSPRFSVTKPRLIMRGSDGLGFTIWNVQAKLVVNTTDNYQ